LAVGLADLPPQLLSLLQECRFERELLIRSCLLEALDQIAQLS
jgi:hypothetical protein